MFEFILIGIASILNFVLTALILSRRSKLNRYQVLFAIGILCVGVWGVSTIALNIYFTMFWERILFESSILALFLIVQFSFDYSSSRNNKFFIQSSSLAAIISSALILFTKTIVVSVSELPNGVDVELGPLMGLFIAYVFYLLFLLMRNFYIGFKETTAIKKLQLRYIVFGIICFVSPTLLTNLLLPVFDIYAYNNLGVIFSLFFTVSVSFAIIKHRLFSIGTLLAKILKSLSVGTFLFIIVLLQRLFKDRYLHLGLYEFESLLLDFVTAVIVGLFIENGIRYIEKTIGKALNSEVSRLEDLTRQIDSHSSDKVRFDTAVDSILSILEEAFPSSSFYFLRKTDSGVTSLGSDPLPFDLLEIDTSDLNESLVLQERSDLQEKYPFLGENRISFIGFIIDDVFFVVQAVDRRELYTKTELDILEDIRVELKNIFARVVIHEKVLEFNSTLQVKVAEATSELQEKVQLLEEARQKERDMVDIMGHELRTPLSLIKIKHSVLRRIAEDPDTEFSRELFLSHDEAITEAIENELELLETMLSSAKVDSGNISINRSKVDIVKVTETTILANSEKADQMDLSVKLRRIPDYKYVFADEVKIGEVIDNLISNAIKYTEKGSVTVDIEQIKDDMMKVSVIDTGIGIPEDAIQRLGEKFYRVKQYTGSDIVRPGGTGLGLYVAFNYVKKMDGAIEIKSDPGKGSTFSFTVPIFKDQLVKDDNTKEFNVFKRLGLNKS